MWIRKQNRRGYVEVIGVRLYERPINGFWLIEGYKRGNACTLGEYWKEEQAFKVLDEIGECIRNGVSFYEMPQDEK